MACVLRQCPKVGQDSGTAFIFLPTVQIASTGRLWEVERGWNAFGGPGFSLTVTYNGQFALACRTLVSQKHLYKTSYSIFKSEKGNEIPVLEPIIRKSFTHRQDVMRCIRYMWNVGFRAVVSLQVQPRRRMHSCVRANLAPGRAQKPVIVSVTFPRTSQLHAYVWAALVQHVRAQACRSFLRYAPWSHTSLSARYSHYSYFLHGPKAVCSPSEDAKWHSR